MTTTENLLSYIGQNFEDENVKEILLKNSLLGVVFENSALDNDEKNILFYNRLIKKKHMSVSLKIQNILQNNDIKCIFFKGLFLSQKLYNDPLKRISADIDLYVHKKDYYAALKILLHSGFILINKKYLKNNHHIAITDGEILIELHKNILNPFTMIDEKYIVSNIDTIKIENNPFQTFDTTATLLHLIYHLYMDTSLTVIGLYDILTKKNIPKTKRFLYRAYEIALFSEKYYNQIKWEEIIGDIKKQKLRIIFKKMVMDILEIFPNIFPEFFLQAIYQLDYIEDERDQLYKFIIDFEIEANDNIDSILTNYIDVNWNKRAEKNIHKKAGESILLTKKFMGEKNNQDLSCSIETETITEGLRIIFKISNDDFCISEINDYNTLGSDGVHLLLCGTEEYSYNSIFFFPKLIDGKIKVVVCDVLNSKNTILDNDLINADFYKTNSNYTIIATIKDKFLEENHLQTYFYIGLVISNCSSKTHYRNNQLILSEKESEWYNPVYFAKIDMQ